jgi:endonuclease YncB( thermonuclease family)
VELPPVVTAYKPRTPSPTATVPARDADHDFVSPTMARVHRKWTDRTGKHHTSAVLVDVVDGMARLQTPEKIVHTPVERLSDEDFAYLAATGVKETKPRQLVGKVVSVHDGDTVTVLDENNHQYKIRLASIDAPERSQAFGQRSREALADKVFGKTIRVDWREHDKYGRTVGTIYLGGRCVNTEMVKEGWAWQYRKYSDSPELAIAEKTARGSGLGLWSKANPEPPWEFRHNEQSRALAKKKLLADAAEKAKPKAEKPAALPKPKTTRVSAPAESSSDTTHVEGYTRKDGTHVNGYDRRKPGR